MYNKSWLENVATTEVIDLFANLRLISIKEYWL
jgi:hypothetical protein